MTTMTATNRESCGLFKVFVLLLLVTATVAVFAALADMRTEVNGHALRRHGFEAIMAARWVDVFGGPGHDCPDGRTRWAVEMWTGTRAVKVTEGDAFVTAFLCYDSGYVRRMLDPCDPPSGLQVAQ
jgi:hypothetical protein